MRQWQCEKGHKLNPFEVHGHKPESQKSKVAHWLAHLIWVNLCIIWSLFYSLLHKSKEVWGLGRTGASQTSWLKDFFFLVSSRYEKVHGAISTQSKWEDSENNASNPSNRARQEFSLTLFIPGRKKPHQLNLCRCFSCWVLSLSLLYLKYIQLVAKIFFKCFHFLFSFSCKFHFSFI